MLGRSPVPAFWLGLTWSHLGKSDLVGWFGTLNFMCGWVLGRQKLIPRNRNFKKIELPSQSTNELSDAQFFFC